MKRFSDRALLSSFLLVLLFLPFYGIDARFCFASQEIRFPQDSPFLKRLIPFKVSTEQPLSHYPIFDVGQILAVESRGIEVQNKKIWNELDPDLTRKLGINLKKISESSPGRTAIGITYLPMTLMSDLQKEMPLSVSRYGLKKFQSKGKIIDIRSQNKETGEVIFQILDGQPWAPGTTCEIQFSVKRNPVRIPVSSLIHIGTEEYVVRIISPGAFEPKHVSVLDMGQSFAVVDGDLKNGDSIVNEGAILLKLEVQQYLKAKRP